MPSCWNLARLIIVPPIPDSSARCRNLFCVFDVIVKLSGCYGLTWPSNVTGVVAKDLRCLTTSTSSYGLENYTPPELIVGRTRDASHSRRSSFLSTSSFSSCAVSAFGSRSNRIWMNFWDCPFVPLHAAPREHLLVVMREQFPFPWTSRRNFGTHSFDICLLMTFMSL